MQANRLTLTRRDIETIRKLALEVGPKEKAERLASELTQMLEYVEKRQAAEESERTPTPNTTEHEQ